MSDDSSTPTPPSPGSPEPTAGSRTPLALTDVPETQPSGPSANEAWSDVVGRLGDLRDAVSAWAKQAADTPENRKHLDDVRSGLDEAARHANEAFSAAASSDFGRQVADGATQVGAKIGSAAQEMSQAAAPHVASAFAGIADAFDRAAEKVEEAVAPPRSGEVSSHPAAESPASAQPPADDERE
jgi:hypothetical protein